MKRQNENNKHWFFDLLEKNSITLTLLAFSTIITLLNVFAFLKLSPIVQRVILLETRADTYEGEQIRQRVINEEVIKLIPSFNSMEKRTERIEDKLDRLIEKD